RGDDLAAVSGRDVDPRVNLVRPGTVGIVDLEVEARAPKALTYAAVTTRRYRPREDARATPVCLGHRRVLLRQLGNLGVDRGSLGLHLSVLGIELGFQLLLVGDRRLLRVQVRLEVGLGGLLFLEEIEDLRLLLVEG